MKNDDTHSREPAGDDPVEARIVAWVLGEASEFEAAEMERLCAVDPDLEAFRQRTLALHGLLVAGESKEDDKDWKLPAAKRAAVEAVIAGDEGEIASERRSRRSAKRALVGIAACLAASVAVWRIVDPLWIRTAIPASPEMKVDFSASADGATPIEDVESLREAVKNQSDMVDELRKQLSTIERTKGVLWNEDKSQRSRGGLDELGNVRSAQDLYNELEQKKTELSSQIKQLEKYSSEQSLAYAAGLSLDDNPVKDLYPKYLDQKRELEQLKTRSGLGEQSPEVVAASDSMARLKREMDEKLVTTREMLQSQLEFSEAHLDQIAALRNQRPEDAIKRGIDEEDYVDAKRSFEVELEKLQEMKLRLSGATIGVWEGDSGALAKIQQNDGRAGSSAGNPEGPTRSSAALTEEHSRNADEVRRGLYVAEGKFNLGRYDEARTDYENVLRVDPYNSTARRGMEKVAQAKTDYYRAAYDQTRAELLVEVDKAQELQVPATGKPGNEESALLAGNRSGDNAVTRGNIDGLLNNPQRPEGIVGRELVESGTELDKMSGLAGDPDPRTVPGRLEGTGNGLSGGMGGGIPAQAPAAAPKSMEEVSDYLAGNLRFRVQDEGTKALVPRKGVDFGTFNVAPGEPASPVPDAEPLAMTMEKSKSQTAAPMDTPDDRMADQPAEGESALESLKESKKELAVPKPAVKPVADSPEIEAKAEPFSTFSLSVSDVSFQLAKAALARGERPDPATIKVEQFYNAVDYGDPAPAAGEPVTATIEQAAHPVIPGRNLVRIGVRTGSTGRSAKQSLRLTLLIDRSGSMVREDRRAAMLKATTELAKLLTAEDRVSVIGFSRQASLLAENVPGNETGRLMETLDPEASEGGTNLEQAFALADAIATRHRLAGAQNRIVLFTDGAANLGDADPARLATLVKRLRNKGMAFDIAGIGAEDLNDRLLAELARNGNGRYYVAADNLAGQLAGAFRPAAEDAKVQVKFNPERVGAYKLIGFEESRLKTEDFRNDAVDAAELAAEEAAVALYQVEVLPGGRGELGEVSVRFREADSGTTVERNWTIPHDERAAAFDRATPAMQLAGLSMLAAEKLRGGDMAAATDFRTLSAAISSVGTKLRGNAKAAEMLRLIGMLRE